MITLHETGRRELHLLVLNGTLREQAARDARIMDLVFEAAAQADDAIQRAVAIEDALDDARDEADEARRRCDALDDKCLALMSKVEKLEARLRGEADPDDEITPTCKGCGQPLIWAVTAEGKKIPLDAKAAVYRNTGRTHAMDLPIVERVKGSAVTHFATCAKANEFSGSKR